MYRQSIIFQGTKATPSSFCVALDCQLHNRDLLVYLMGIIMMETLSLLIKDNKMPYKYVHCVELQGLMLYQRSRHGYGVDLLAVWV